MPVLQVTEIDATSSDAKASSIASPCSSWKVPCVKVATWEHRSCSSG
jgi:hypothetical protein